MSNLPPVAPLPPPTHSPPMPSGTPMPNPLMPTPVSDAPDWAAQLEAWATLATAVIALATALFTLWLLRHQMREADRAHEEAADERADAAVDREQARQDREFTHEERRDAEAVQARTILISDPEVTIQHMPEHVNVSYVSAKIQNFGQGPVLDLTVQLVSVDRIRGDSLSLKTKSVLAPGETLRIQESLDHTNRWDGFTESMPLHALLIVTFTDMAGRRWSRRFGTQPMRTMDAEPGESRWRQKYP